MKCNVCGIESPKMDICPECDKPMCPECERVCVDCGEIICALCETTCEDCGDSLCPSCSFFNDDKCSNCVDKEDEE